MSLKVNHNGPGAEPCWRHKRGLRAQVELGGTGALLHSPREKPCPNLEPSRRHVIGR